MDVIENENRIVVNPGQAGLKILHSWSIAVIGIKKSEVDSRKFGDLWSQCLVDITDHDRHVLKAQLLKIPAGHGGRLWAAFKRQHLSPGGVGCLG